MKQKLVVLTGAGMSAESGLSTFRDSGGLWDQYDVKDVASIEGWINNPKLVQDFYNKRRAELKDHTPNEGHYLIKELENIFHVTIITQNVDNFHERAGSQHVIHLHGELSKVRSVKNPSLIYETLEDVHMGDLAEDGNQLRPYIVWFGEEVPKMEEAIKYTAQAEIFLVIGTSLQVYPAASLLNFVPPEAKIYIIDPNPLEMYLPENIIYIQKGATEGLKIFKQKISK
ncbi:SIR2 family NAD-dependent protein deacylase [Apibacter adventoris]|uniref:SIR2 family NAD-dependent protein deacylase n=1 Tax=Apibacter adventoris TaxID=1679466 RepID=UPI000CF6E0B7|nr:Sir2 family NAD-dependent protein deacetylase [Apibacter adventoris]PQL93272.1 NAD-dependent protein deacylase [Apibacter adventoris]